MCLVFQDKQSIQELEMVRSLKDFLSGEVKWSESCSVISDFLRPHGLYGPWNSLGQNIGLGILSLLQGIFPTQGLNPGLPGLPHCRQILYQLSYKWSPRILEWVAYPFCSGSSQPRNRNQPGSPTLQADSLWTELWGKPPYQISNYKHSFIWFFCVCEILRFNSIKNNWIALSSLPNNK